jgi:hypothetical protein
MLVDTDNNLGLIGQTVTSSLGKWAMFYFQ